MEGTDKMTEPLTIESFFLADYAKVKARNEELENEIRDAKSKYDAQLPETGFIDLRTPINLVRIDTECSKYRLFDCSDAPWKELSINELTKIVKMNDDDLLNELKGLKTSYCSKAIEVKEKTFPFTVQFKSYKGVWTYAYDPDYDADGLVTFTDDGVDTNCWVISGFKNECIRYALEEARETINERISAMRDIPQESKDGDTNE